MQKFYLQLHTITAAFLLPAILMFLITGALYTWGIKGTYDVEKLLIEVNEPLANEETAILTFIENEVKNRGYRAPTGKPKYSSQDGQPKVSWSGSNMDLSFSVSKDPSIVKLELRHTTLYRKFVQLHKAKGGTLFKVYAVVLAIGLFLLSLSGYILALKKKNYRNLTYITTAIGLVFFVIAVWLG